MSDTVPVTVNLPVRANREWQVVEQYTAENPEGTVVTVRLAARPIVPATVMVEMPRDIVEGMVDSAKELELDRSPGDRMIAAFRAAIARKPCPVMVCRDSGDDRHFYKCFKDSVYGTHVDRRTCKLTEGHGGEHG